MATVIKQNIAFAPDRGSTVRPIAFSFEDMSGRADEYLDTVRHEAAKIVQQAHHDAEQIRHRAEQAGRQAAQDAIEKILDEKVARQMQTLRPAIEGLVDQLRDARGAWQTHWEQSGIRLATKIAERILRRELPQQPELALELLREALELASGSAEIKVHMNPADLERLGAQVHVLTESLCQLAPSDVVADESITPGGCRVTTRFGAIDQRIETQLDRIAEELS